MKIRGVTLALAAAALAAVDATGISGATCSYGTPEPTTPSPTTPQPTTPGPTTPAPTTPSPTTPSPTTPSPTTPSPTTPSPTTPSPTTPEPTSPSPTTPAPTTPAPTTPSPTTPAPPVNCELYTALTDPTPWSTCVADDSGVYYHTKVLGIKTPAQNDGTPCPSETDPSRQAKEKCPSKDCVLLSPEADLGEYGACFKDATTGKYIKSKILGIKDPAQNGGKCDEKDRVYSVPCAAIDCVWFTPGEDKGPFGECADDGTGKWFKSKVLGIKTPAQNGGTDCVPEDQRTYKVLCDAVNCVAVAEADDKGEFGPCQDDGSGKWFKSKVLAVKTKEQNGGTCDPKDRTVKEVCTGVDCVAYTKDEDPGPFSECKNDGSGKYYRSKVLGIKIAPQFGGKDCDSVEQRTYTELCPAENCVAVDPKDDFGPFGACEDNGSGKFYMSKVLGVKIPEKNGGTCLESDRIYKELCPGVDCVPFTEKEDQGPFGDCENDGTDKWYKHKVLGIKVPAQYGGKDCEPEAKRTVSEFCPPVNCVPLNVADDQGPYGECQLDVVTGKWIKTKVLGIKDGPLYGGSCDEKDRTVTSPCKGIDCVVFSPKDDPGPFGDCANDGTDKWYKSKVLQIEQEAQYGGLCPTELERTYKELCPAVNCVAVDPKDDQGEFGDCADDGTGKWYKSKVLDVKTSAQYGGTCFESDRTYKELCKAVNCEVNTPLEDLGEFGACENDGTNKWYKSKILGIKTPGQYGGTPCAPEDQRVYRELCPAENCVAVDPKDDNGAFGDCTNDGTNKFYKSKVLGIKVPEKNGGTCLESDRTYKELCPAVNCEAYTEETDPGQFGDCKNDGTGKYYKSKVLGIKTPAEYGGKECESEAKRTVSEFCPPVNCVPLNVGDDQGEYGECQLDTATGKYVKSKVLGIKDPAKNGGTCDEKDRTVTAPCKGVDCVVNLPTEDKGAFGPCADDGTGKWFKSKVLGIKEPAQYGGLCPTEAERTYKELCPAVNCVAVDPKDDKGPFGECKNDGSNKWYKSKVLDVKTPAQFGGTCFDSDRVYKELCQLVNCVPYTQETDPGQYGDCQNNGQNVWYKSKVLGIQTPAQYGGQDCVPEDQRRVYVLCPAEKCVPLAPADDKGPFGPCQVASDGKWYKSKILGIKTPAKNGGSCLDSDRTYKELCTAVPCVIYTPAEDPGAFGPCTDDGTGKWYKSKTLGVKTDALYGGTCPSTTDPSRKYKELCPAVNCVVKSAADDTSPYSATCSRFPDGKYYRTKVLPIVVQPQYGGKACPSEADRTLKQECPTSGGYCLPTDPFYDQCVPKLGQCGDQIVDKYYEGYELELVKGLLLWQCCDRCATTAGCVAYSFTANSDVKKNECSLKWDTDGTKNKKGVISSTVLKPKESKCSFRDNYYNSLPLSDLATISTNSLAACCDACVGRAKCATFNLNNGICELKESSWANIYIYGSGWRAGRLL